MYTKFAVVAALAAYAEALNLQNEAEQTPVGQVQRGKLWETIDTHRDYDLGLSIKPKGKVHGWNNIIHLTADNQDYGSAGSRIPGIWFYSNSTRMHVRMSRIGSKNDGCDSCPALTMDQWSKVNVKLQGKTLTVAVNGNVCCTNNNYSNANPGDPNVRVYASDPWWAPANVELKDFSYTNADPAMAAHSGAVFGDLSFLDGLDSFNDAQAARDRYVAEQARLDKVRTDKARIYFGAKQRALSAARAKATFDAALEAKITAHEDAKAAHAKAVSDHELAKAETGTKAGVLAAAIEAHRLSSVRKAEAHAAVGHAQDEVKHAEKALAEAEATLKAAKKEMHEATEVDNTASDAVKAARSAHSAAQIKEAEAKDKVAAKKIAAEDAREARLDARDRKIAADNAAHAAAEAKSDAYAAAVRAHRAKIAHAKANTQHHL